MCSSVAALNIVLVEWPVLTYYGGRGVWIIMTLNYSCSQLPPALGVFRWFLSQFLINFYEILQALFSSIPVPTREISWNFMSILKVRPFDM